jgi:P-type Mg2+ transporter
VKRIPVEDVVPGDVVELAAGTLVSADGIVLASQAAALTNEPLLTGEPYPVEKRAGDCVAENPAEAFNALFGGAALVSGEATMLVVATGSHTRSAASLQRYSPTGRQRRSSAAVPQDICRRFRKA